MKNQKGITLIALVITIIVMIILVGVTVFIAVDGGIMPNAKTSATKTQKEVDRETLLAAAAASINHNTRRIKCR